MRSERLKFIMFSLVGVFNTLFDIALYFVIYTATKSIITANIVSTTAALIGSYFLNSKLTFKSKKWTAKSFIVFALVTLFGLWVLQTATIYAIAHVLKNMPASPVKTLLPKVLATGVTFIWNYVWYNKVIFKDRTRADTVLIALDEL